MNIPFELSAFVDRLAGDAGQRLSLALMHFLWQGVLIAAAAALLMRLLGRRSSQRRYLIGVAAMIAMAVAPVITFCLVEPPDWSQFMAEETSDLALSDLSSAELELMLATLETDAAQATQAMPSVPPRPLTWPERVRLYQPYALLLWLCGTGLFALRLGIGLHASWRFGHGRASLPEGWRNIAERVASQLGVKTPRIFVSERVVEAVAVGLLKPMVLLPAAWIGNVPLDVLEAVLAHEISHLRRYDLWVNLLQRCVEAALFYHPAVWWLSRRIRQEREYCCDELAATVVSGRAAYARALEFVATERVAATQRATFAAALAAGMGGAKMALLDRVRRVLGSDVKPNRGTWISEGLLALAVPAALWACIATVAPNVATADDTETTQKDGEPSAGTHIGDVEYWQERGVEAGMITVLREGQLFDLATGESIDPDQKTTRPFNLNIRPVPQNGVQWHQESDDVAKALRELRQEMQSLRKELDDLRGNRPSAKEPEKFEYRIRKLPPEAPKPPRVKLPPVPSDAPAPPALPPTPHVKVDRLIRVAPLEIDGKKVNVIVEEFREGEGPAKEIQLRVLRRSSDVTVPEPAKADVREWKLPPGAPKPRGDLQSVQHVEQLEIDGKKVNVIVEEVRDGDAPAKEIRLRVLRRSEDVNFADPAKTEAGHKQAEEARERAEDAMQKSKALSTARLQELQAQVERERVQVETEQAARDTEKKIHSIRLFLERAKSDNPGEQHVREGEANLERFKKLLERQLLLLKALKSDPAASPEEITRQIDSLIERQSGKAAPNEAEQRLHEMQRQLEKQQKIIDELQKKLEEASQKGDSPDSPEDTTDATKAEAASSTRIDIPALSKDTLNQVQQAISFSLGLAR